MHYFYFFIDPLKGTINYLLGLVPTVFLIVLVLLCISHWGILVFRGKVLWAIRKKKTLAGRQFRHITTTTLHLHVAKYKAAFSEHERTVFYNKIGYMLRGLFLISFGRTIISLLFWSFVDTGILLQDRPSHTAEIIDTNEMLGKSDADIKTLEINTIREVFGEEAIQAISPAQLASIDEALYVIAIYEFALLILAWLFFLISLGNTFLKNVWRFLVTVCIFVHLASILLFQYTHVWEGFIV